MDTTILGRDLAIQKEKLTVLQTLDSPPVLIENQSALIADIERQLNQTQSNIDEEN